MILRPTTVYQLENKGRLIDLEKKKKKKKMRVSVPNQLLSIFKGDNY